MAKTSLLPALVAVAFGTPILGALFSACGLVPWAALLIAAVVMALLAARYRTQIAASLPLERPVGLAIFAAVAVLAAVRLWSMSIFMMDSAHAELSVLWFDPFYIRHNCLSASWLAARLAMNGAPNAYDATLYDTVLYPKHLGRFMMDEFLYPSPILLLPRVGLVFTESFLTLRAAWFAVEAALFASAYIVLAKWVGGKEGQRILFLTPAVLLATPILLTLQIGNFQLAAVALTMLAFVAFEKERPVTGGALLGFALFKIFPGIVLIPLAIQRRWRALFWTAVSSTVYTGLSILWMGTSPFVQFFKYDLPRLTSGSAWDFLELDFPMIHQVAGINQGIPGLALKLREFGLYTAAHAHDAMRTYSTVFTVIVFALAVYAAFRLESSDRLGRAQVWLSLVGLAALRSPFVPDTYGLVATLWLWAVVMPRFWSRRATLLTGALLWIPFSLVLPFEGPLATEGVLRLFLGLAVQVIALAFTGSALVQRAQKPAIGLIEETA
jgi:hypothetical protein